MPVVPLDEINLLHSTICQAVGDPRRIQILYALHDKPMHVGALAELLDTPQSTISRHLAILRQRGLVTTQRDGTTVTYSVAECCIIPVLDSMRQLLREVLLLQANKLDE
jgi:ArsR family transcriptional regulator